MQNNQIIGLCLCIFGATLVLVGILNEIRQLRYAVVALVSISAKKGPFTAIAPKALEKLAGVPPTPVTSSHIHFPTSMFPEQTDEDWDRKHPPQLK